AGHADAVVPDGQHAVVLVDFQLDVQVGGVDLQILVLEGGKPQFVQGIGRVRDQLAKERVLVGVDGMDHQLEQLMGFCLELELFDVLCHVDRVPPPEAVTGAGVRAGVARGSSAKSASEGTCSTALCAVGCRGDIHSRNASVARTSSSLYSSRRVRWPRSGGPS